MKVLIVLAHPERKSFNGAMLDTAVEYFQKAGHEVQISDLYRLNFNPVSDRHNFQTVKDPDYFKQQQEEMYAAELNSFSADLESEFAKLQWCDLLILQFPLWWFSVPAILKGWFDRDLAMGRAYGGGRWFEQGVFAGKRAFLSLTTGGVASSYEADGLHGDINQILYPLNHGVLRFIGFDVLPPFLVWSPVRLDEEARRHELLRYSDYLAEIENGLEPIKYPLLSDYDEQFRLKNPVKQATRPS